MSIRSSLNRSWKKIIDHYKGTVIGLGFSASKEDLNAIYDRQFAEGKRAADFAGMIGQSALCLFFSMFLQKHSGDNGLNLLEYNALMMSSWTFFALYLYIVYKTAKVLTYFFIRDATNNKTTVGKIYPVFVSIFMGLLFLYGQTTVVQAIAKSNALLK